MYRFNVDLILILAQYYQWSNGVDICKLLTVESTVKFNIASFCKIILTKEIL